MGLLFGLHNITYAYFSDAATTVNQSFRTGVLQASLRSGQGNFVPDQALLPGQQVNRDIYIGKTAGSLPLQYRVSFQYLDGDLDLCQQLDLKIWYDHYHGDPAGGYANRDMRLKYSGKLANLANLGNEDFKIPHPDDQFDLDNSDGTEQWFYYSISLPDNVDDSFQGKTCHFNFDIQAWQLNFLHYGEGGFTDEKTIDSTIQIGSWTPVLGSIGDQSGTEGQLLSFTIQASDPNGDPLTYSASNLPTGASFDPITRVFSWVPAVGQNGTYENIHFEVSDGRYSDAEDITITISEMPPPQISNVTVTNITASSAEIDWQTNQLTTSKVEYGTTDSYGLTIESLIFVQSHQISLSGLTTETTYHYRVSSKNSADKEASSSDNTFTTL